MACGFSSKISGDLGLSMTDSLTFSGCCCFLLFISPGDQQTRTAAQMLHRTPEEETSVPVEPFSRVPSSDYSIVGIFGNKISTQCFHSLWIIHLWRWGFHFDISQYVQLQPSFWLQLISQLTLYLFRFHTGSSKYASVQQNEEFTWISSYLIITFYSWY